MLNEYEKEIIKNKLDNAQKRSRVRNFTIEEVIEFIEEVENVTKEMIKEYPSKNIRFSLRKGSKNGDFVYEGTCIDGYITKEGYVDLDKLEINRRKASSSHRKIMLYDFKKAFDNETEKNIFNNKYNVFKNEINL